jgi:hypothetical protein
MRPFITSRIFAVRLPPPWLEVDINKTHTLKASEFGSAAWDNIAFQYAVERMPVDLTFLKSIGTNEETYTLLSKRIEAPSQFLF